MRVLKGAEVSVKMKEEVQAALAKCKGSSKAGDYPCGRESG